MASSRIASMPAHTASRRALYSSAVMCGTVRVAAAFGLVAVLVRGKLPHRLGDLVRAGHEEVLLWRVERHPWHVWRRDPHDRTVEAVECVVRDGSSDLGAKPTGEVVLMHDHSLARLAHRLEDGVAVEWGQRAQVDDLDADTLRLELLSRLQAVVGHQAPREAAQPGALAPQRGGPNRHQVIAVRHLLGHEPVHLLVLEEQDG